MMYSPSPCPSASMKQTGPRGCSHLFSNVDNKSRENQVKHHFKKPRWNEMAPAKLLSFDFFFFLGEFLKYFLIKETISLWKVRQTIAQKNRSRLAGAGIMTILGIPFQSLRTVQMKAGTSAECPSVPRGLRHGFNAWVLLITRSVLYCTMPIPNTILYWEI